MLVTKPTGSDKIIDLPNKISLAQDYMNLVSLKGNSTNMKFALVITPPISLVKDQTRQLRERNVEVIFLVAKNSMGYSESWKIKTINSFSVQLNQFYVFTEISSW